VFISGYWNERLFSHELYCGTRPSKGEAVIICQHLFASFWCCHDYTWISKHQHLIYPSLSKPALFMHSKACYFVTSCFMHGMINSLSASMHVNFQFQIIMFSFFRVYESYRIIDIHYNGGVCGIQGERSTM